MKLALLALFIIADVHGERVGKPDLAEQTIFQATDATTQKADLPPICANNAAAKKAGLSAGNLYRTGGDPDMVAIVH
jgi:hypothetical protein